MKQELSKEQREIAFYQDCEEPLLVKASAGSGKTRILTERVRYLLTDKQDKFFSVLCLTFTIKARDEMKDRLNDIPKLSERAFIGNFHDFCLNQIIRKQRHEIGLDTLPHIFDENDKKKIIEEVIYQNKDLAGMYEFPDITDEREKSKKQQELIAKCVNFISDAKRRLIVIPEHITSWANWGEKNTFLYKNYNDTLQNQNAMDFDDILLYAYRILTERASVANIYRRIYRYIMVDEAQDLNYAQYHIIKAICGDTHKKVLFVGDPNQAIYAFNGASSKFMLENFVEDFKATIREVPHNFRSSTKVLELAHHIRSNGSMPNNYFEGIREMQPFETEQAESDWIIAKIKEWVQRGYYQEKDVKIPISLENIAVLARNRYVLKELLTKLDEDEVLKNQYYMRKGVERFEPESQLIKVFDFGLRVIVNPMDVLHFNQLYYELGIDNNEEKYSAEILLSLNQNENLDSDQKKVLDIVTEAWKALINNPKLIDKTLTTIRQKALDTEFADEEGLKIDYDIKEFQRFWKAFLRNTPSEGQTLVNFRYFLALNSIDENKKGLTLATVHTVKGLEYDIVFLMGMNEGVLPDYRAKELSEEQNNAYVAVTRAKKCIYVSYPKTRIMPWGSVKMQFVSRFIRDFPT